MADLISFAVSGMKCGGCESKVVTALTALSGVVNVKASAAEKRVDVEYFSEQINPDEFEDAILELGFKID